MTTIELGLAIAYCVVGFCVFCYAAAVGWSSGDAVNFVISIIAGLIVAVFWLPVSMVYVPMMVFIYLLQEVMNKLQCGERFSSRPKKPMSDKEWDKQFNFLTALDEEFYKDKK